MALLDDLFVQDRIKHRVNLVLNVLDDQAQALALDSWNFARLAAILDGPLQKKKCRVVVDTYLHS